MQKYNHFSFYLSFKSLIHVFFYLVRLNGMQVDGMKLIAEPAPIVPPDVLCHLYSQPEERKRLKGNMLRWLQKL